MSSLRWINPQFITSAADREGFPTLRDEGGKLLTEIAFVGRSNVGKSSLLNHLFQTKKLARISATPGKTQLVNFFTADNALTLVDLPGYGFAKVPRSVRIQWGSLIQDYLEQRETLKLVLFLFDIRRTPQEDDLELMEWFRARNLPVILVLTKSDKVTRNQGVGLSQKIQRAFGEQMPTVMYSTLKNWGRDELTTAVERHVG